MTDIQSPMPPGETTRRETYAVDPAGTYRAAYVATETRVAPTVRRIAWGAVLAGAIIAIVIHIALNLLGLAVGANTIEPALGAEPLRGMGILVAVWLTLASFIALFIGGVVAARYAPAVRKSDGVMHGLVVWSLMSVLTFWAMGSAVGNLTIAAGGAASEIVQGVGPRAGEEFPTEPGAMGSPGQGEPRLVDAAQRTAEAVSRGALIGFIALCVGALGGALGGRYGVAREYTRPAIAKPN